MKYRFLILLIVLALLAVLANAQEGNTAVSTSADTPVALVLAVPAGLVEPVTFSIDTLPSNGSLVGTAPQLVYTPNAGFVGTDSFSYTVIGSDGNFASATVSIEVSAVAAATFDSTSFNFELATVSAVSIDFQMALGTDYELLKTPLHGTLSGQIPNVTYTPDASFVGTDSFSYAVTVNGTEEIIDVIFTVGTNPAIARDFTLPPSLPQRSNVGVLQGLSPEAAALAQFGTGALADFNIDATSIMNGNLVQVVINTRNLDAAYSRINALGGSVSQTVGSSVIAQVPTSALIQLGTDAAISGVRLPQAGIITDFTGAVETEGTAFINADEWHTAGFKGQGVKVGVIDFGFDGFATTAAAETTCAVAPWHIGTNAPYQQTLVGGNPVNVSVHGTGVVEIICDVAPDATVYPVHAFTDANFVSAVNYLINTHDVDIITASLAWAQTAGDGITHITSQAVNDAVTNHDVLFTVATGNRHLGHWEGAWNPMLITPNTGSPYNTHDFNPIEVNPNTDDDWGNTINNSNLLAAPMSAGTQVDFALVWQEADWANPATDLDMHLLWFNETTEAWEFVDSSISDNIASNIVGERIQYTVPDTKPGWYRLMIVEDPVFGVVVGTPWLQLSEVVLTNQLQYRYDFSSVSDPAAATEAFGVGAVYHANSVLEAYSGRGPSNTVNGGAPLPDGTFQPQVAAPTGGDTVMYPSGFFGTSGAAPHAAGAAAVIWSAFPFWTNLDAENFLKNEAIDAGTAGADYAYGYGLLNLGTAPVRGSDSVGVFRVSDRSWYLRNTNDSGGADVVFEYGDPSTDIPLAGDWDGDGDDTAGIFRSGTFFLKNDNSNGAADISFNFGAATDIPIVGDWDNDGVDTVGVYRPSIAAWFLTNSTDGSVLATSFTYGIANETPVVGDWNGDGISTVGIFRASDRTWHLRNDNSGGSANIIFEFGDPSLDKPVVGDWNADGQDTIGVYRFGTGEWYLKNSNDGGFADLSFGYGIPNEMPVVGNWDGQ